ncbi:transposase [Burkholderia ubonensis]|uniref:IS66 family transposase n=1 Tax=Burkholderia ubonensis TaxID=101571 RepID=UPI00075219DD|nr:IS66 family transposase [Burkholderia ubonensis]KWF15207.1 transposase [Burkholderia ubonensis]
MTTANAYPDDIEALKALLLERDARIGHLEDVVESHKAATATDKAEIEHLKLLIAKLRRMQFGRRSEKLDRQIEQLELRLEELEADEGAAPIEIPRTPRTAPEQVQRKPLPDHLPREIQNHWPESRETCAACGAPMKQLGEDVAEQLEYVPASFRVIRHVRPKLTCSCCDHIAQAAAPSRPIERGMAGPGLLAHVLVAKFADHLPLYRQSVIYAREGVELDRSLLAKWVGRSAALLQPLVDALRRHVMAATKLHADDTPVPVLAPGNGKTKTGRLWVYVRDDRASGDATPPAVWFAYTPDRKGIHPQQHLESFNGTLQADAYGGYQAIYETGRVAEAACWAHARRQFYELHAARPNALNTEALERIGALYKVEEQIRGKPPDECRAHRQAQARRLLDQLHAWLSATLETLSRKSDTSRAILYALNRWEALTRYCDDGHLEIDNLPVERALRGVAVGRNNWLFAGSLRAGRRAAAVMSLVQSAKMNGHDPYAYLKDVLARLPEHQAARLDELLPQNWKPAPA